MRFARILAAVGVIAGLIAVAGILITPGDTGDAGAVEESLNPSEATSTTLAPVSTTVGDETKTTSPSPLWAANDTSLLTDVTSQEGALPRRLVIDALEIDAPIGPYGVDGNGQMDVPDNVTEVGWYKYGPSPGEPGSAVLAAHVDLRGPGRGLFYELDELEVGDLISVDYEDGSRAEFEVVARSTYLKTELPLDAIFSRGGEPVLTLVTCGGGFSQSARSYDSNVVIYATPVEAGQSGNVGSS